MKNKLFSPLRKLSLKCLDSRFRGNDELHENDGLYRNDRLRGNDTHQGKKAVLPPLSAGLFSKLKPGASQQVTQNQFKTTHNASQQATRNSSHTTHKPAGSYKLSATKLKALITAPACGFLLSCGQTPRQYETPSTLSSDGSINQASTGGGLFGKAAFLRDTATRAKGGLSLYEKAVETEAEKEGRVRKNSLIPISYRERSAGNINMDTLYKESLDILNIDFTSSGYSFYQEGLAVIWRDDPPRVPEAVFILSAYQGTMDSGPVAGNMRVGESFADWFSPEQQDILQDPKARRFITSLYRHLENSEEDCLKSQSCSLSINPHGNYIVFQLPKMIFLFGNNERRKLVQMAMTRDDSSACLKSPFDLIKAQFTCENPDGSKTFFGLGDSYKEVTEKSGISRDLPLTYTNTSLFQRTKAVSVFWKRNNFEEKVRTVPETSHLSAVSIGSHEYNLPFLINQSLVKISLTGPDTLRLSLEPLAEGRDWQMEDIIKKTAAAEASSFYLSTKMPQIKDNFPLQRNLIKALLDLLEENYKSFYSADGQNSEVQIHKRVFGEHSDTFALSSSGLLTVRPKKPSESFKHPLQFVIEIEEAGGDTRFILALADGDFENYVLNNQADLDLNEPVQALLGFKLGDKVYLRDKKPGAGTAIAAYFTEEGQTLVALAGYSDESESPAVYPSGRDKNIIFEKSSTVSVGGALLHIHPTAETRVIEGRLYDEYEISKISADGGDFFGEIRSLCGIEGFDMKMGLYDRDFSKRLADEIHKARLISADYGERPVERTDDTGGGATKPGGPATANPLATPPAIEAAAATKPATVKKPFEGCFYMAPTDSTFSGVKRGFFFPKHNLILGFSDRELSLLIIYRKPPQKNRGGSP